MIVYIGFQFSILTCGESFGYYELSLGVVGFSWCSEWPLLCGFGSFYGYAHCFADSVSPSGLHVPSCSKPFPVGYSFLYLP